MKNSKLKNFSLIGLTLLTASAFISAVGPARKVKKLVNSANNGVLRPFSCGDGPSQAIFSCCNIAGSINCHLTIPSATTGVGSLGTMIQTFFGKIYDTQGNTSITVPNAADTTSVFIRIA